MATSSVKSRFLQILSYVTRITRLMRAFERTNSFFRKKTTSINILEQEINILKALRHLSHKMSIKLNRHFCVYWYGLN